MVYTIVDIALECHVKTDMAANHMALTNYMHLVIGLIVARLQISYDNGSSCHIMVYIYGTACDYCSRAYMLATRRMLGIFGERERPNYIAKLISFSYI